MCEKAYIFKKVSFCMVVVKANLISKKVSSNSKEAFALLQKERFGERDGEKVFYSFFEAVYLVEAKKMKVFDFQENEISLEKLVGKFQRQDKNFMTKYIVFKDLRKKGNLVKSALKFGAEFRVYEKGRKIGKDHATWILFCCSEHDKLSMKDFSSKNRVAHSTNKKLLIAVVDDENDVSYYEARWLKI